MGWADFIAIEDVKNARTWAGYASQTAGIPYPTTKELVVVNKESAKLFEMYPNLTWSGLCQLALWAKARRRRYANAGQLLRHYKFAYQDGYLPEIDSEWPTRQLDEQITAALLVEQSPEWRRRLLTSRGEGRKRVYEAWLHKVDL